MVHQDSPAVWGPTSYSPCPPMPDDATRQTWLQAIAQSHLRNGEHLRPLDALRLASQLPAGDAQTKALAASLTVTRESDSAQINVANGIMGTSAPTAEKP